LPLFETAVYLMAAVLLFPAFGGGVWIIESALRQKTRLGGSARGGNQAKAAAGAAWLGCFFVIVGGSLALDSFPVFTAGIFIWEAIGLYGAYRWYELQEALEVPKLQV